MSKAETTGDQSGRRRRLLGRGVACVVVPVAVWLVYGAVFPGMDLPDGPGDVDLYVCAEEGSVHELTPRRAERLRIRTPVEEVGGPERLTCPTCGKATLVAGVREGEKVVAASTERVRELYQGTTMPVGRRGSSSGGR